MCFSVPSFLQHLQCVIDPARVIVFTPQHISQVCARSLWRPLGRCHAYSMAFRLQILTGDVQGPSFHRKLLLETSDVPPRRGLPDLTPPRLFHVFFQKICPNPPLPRDALLHTPAHASSPSCSRAERVTKKQRASSPPRLRPVSSSFLFVAAPHPTL